MSLNKWEDMTAEEKIHLRDGVNTLWLTGNENIRQFVGLLRVVFFAIMILIGGKIGI